MTIMYYKIIHEGHPNISFELCDARLVPSETEARQTLLTLTECDIHRTTQPFSFGLPC